MVVNGNCAHSLVYFENLRLSGEMKKGRQCTVKIRKFLRFLVKLLFLPFNIPLQRKIKV